MGMLAVFCTNAINIYAGINGIEVSIFGAPSWCLMPGGTVFAHRDGCTAAQRDSAAGTACPCALSLQQRNPTSTDSDPLLVICLLLVSGD